MNKIKNLLKGSPIAMVIAGVLVAGVVSAAVLAVYTTMIGTGTVEQSVVFGNGDTSKEYTIGASPAIAGNTYTQDYNLMNKSETTAPVRFVTNQCIVGGGFCNDTAHDEPGVETSYWSSVELEDKDDEWAINSGNDIKATLTYELVSSTFNYKIEGKVLQSDQPYSLIYYADKPERFEDWGGNNPGRLIAELTSDSEGNISKEGSQNLGIDLPHANDWNGSVEADYCNNDEGDDYNLCRGAKIWLVPTDDYDKSTKTLTAWNPNDYLFETDLITYDDLDNGEALYLGKGTLNFFIKNELAINLAPGEYKVKTEVVPVVPAL